MNIYIATTTSVIVAMYIVNIALTIVIATLSPRGAEAFSFILFPAVHGIANTQLSCAMILAGVVKRMDGKTIVDDGVA